jgi:hypothetical protein
MVKSLSDGNLRVMWVLLTCILAINVFFVSTLFWPNYILSVDEPFKILTPVVPRGEYVHYQLNYQKRANISGYITVQLYDGYCISLDDGIYSNVPTVKDKKPINGMRQIPVFVNPGTYILRWTATYRPWPWRTLTYTFNSERFEVR